MTAQKYIVSKLRSGFTLIELLIVMAILGVLAVVVLVAINPAEQMRRARDTGRISGVQQIGRAMAAYYTANGALPAGGTWDDVLTSTQELTTIPAEVPNAAGLCSSNQVSGWCYAVNGTADHYVIFSSLESTQRKESCAAGATTAYAVYSSFDGRGGVVQAVPSAGTALTYCE